MRARGVVCVVCVWCVVFGGVCVWCVVFHGDVDKRDVHEWKSGVR